MSDTRPPDAAQTDEERQSALEFAGRGVTIITVNPEDLGNPARPQPGETLGDFWLRREKADADFAAS